MYKCYIVAELSLMDVSNNIIKNISLHIGKKAGIKVDGTLSELSEEFKFE